MPTKRKEPRRIKIEGDWESAVERALGRKRPASGWPATKPTPKPKKKRAKRRPK